jgi:ATP-binding cassette subfamily B protein
MRDKKANKDFSKVIKFLNKKAPVYFIFVIINASIVSLCYNIVLSLILKDVVDAIADHNIKLIQRAFFIAFVSFLIAFIFEPVTTKIKNYCVRSTTRKIRQDTFDHMENIRVDIYEQYSSGDILSRLTKDIDALEDIFLIHLPNFCFAVIHGIFAMILMIFLNPYLGVIAIILGLVSVFANYFLSKRIKVYSENYQKDSGDLSQNIVDIQDGFIDMKMNCSEEYFYNKFKNITKRIQKNYEKREKYCVLLETTNVFVENINNIGLMALGLFLAYKGYTSIGIVVSVIRLQGNASYLFQNFSTFLGGVQKALPSARRIFEIFEMKTENYSDPNLSDSNYSDSNYSVSDSNDSNSYDSNSHDSNSHDSNLINEKEVIDQSEHVLIRDLTFSYDGINNVLDGITMSINHGEVVGIMGESGKGKSTFAKILLGFYSPASGEYVINGKHIDTINMKELRACISYVDQDCHLFQQTIEENVRMGNQNASKEDIIHACRLANAHDFIMNLPEGYNTVINETADNISGGQRQRIAIARTLASKRTLLIIDEGTAELDPEAEKIISNTILSLKGEKTIIIITHKPSILEYADKKYRFIDGKIDSLEIT